MKAAVIGAGGWGTALAQVLRYNQLEVTLWAREPEVATEINVRHTNQTYLPGVELDPGLVATSSLVAAVEGSGLILFVVPSQALRSVLTALGREFAWEEMQAAPPLLLQAGKGLEVSTLLRLSEVVQACVPSWLHERLAVLSGPNHAEEVGRRVPSATVVAGAAPVALEIQSLLMNEFFRVYTNEDMVGVELGGALKNIIALAAGMADGLGFGDNTRAALITRGMAEIARLGVRLGAHPLTFAGLAGIGDLFVTCSSRYSRNWRAGYAIGQGQKPEEVLAATPQVVEGVPTTRAALALAARVGVEMPITAQVARVLFEGVNPQEAVAALMQRDATSEMGQLAAWFGESFSTSSLSPRQAQ